MLDEADGELLRAARDAANGRGMFFAFRDATADWKPVTELYDDPAAILNMVNSVRRKMGNVEPRVAASLFYQGFASRLVSPPLASILDQRCMPTMEQDAVSWTVPDSEMLALSIGTAAGITGQADELLDRFVADTFGYHLVPLAETLRQAVAVAPGLLRGNAAASIVSAMRLCGPAGSWRWLATRVLAHRELRGTGTLSDTPAGFTRHSCCLYYRTPQGGWCGDCPLPRSLPDTLRSVAGPHPGAGVVAAGSTCG